MGTISLRKYHKLVKLDKSCVSKLELEEFSSIFGVQKEFKSSLSCDFEISCQVKDILVHKSNKENVVIPSLSPWLKQVRRYETLVGTKSPSPTHCREDLFFENEASKEYKQLLHNWLEDDKLDDDTQTQVSQNVLPRKADEEEKTSQNLSQEMVDVLNFWQSEVGKSDFSSTQNNESEDEGSDSDGSQFVEAVRNSWITMSQPASLFTADETEAFVVEQKKNKKRKKFVPEIEQIHERPFFSKKNDFLRNQKSTRLQTTSIVREGDTYFMPPKYKKTLPDPNGQIKTEKTNPRRLKEKDVGFLPTQDFVSSHGSFAIDAQEAFRSEQNFLWRVLVFELFARSQNGQMPNVFKDPILALAMRIVDIKSNEVAKDERQTFVVGQNVNSEYDLLTKFGKYVEEKDPDFILSYEMQKHGLGYILRRAERVGIKNYYRKLSRAVFGQQDRRHLNDSWGATTQSEFWLTGRYILNLWRIVRKNVTLRIYTLENVYQELLKKPLPYYSPSTIQMWFNRKEDIHQVIEHLFRRIEGVYSILDHLDLLIRTSEMSRFIGCDFHSTLTRGSQYRVESILIRICKAKGFLCPSASKEQVKGQPALEEIALTLEPKSRHYVDPVAVFDFRSLYPSVIIAYNLCFSTFVGKLRNRRSSKGCFYEQLGFVNPYTYLSREEINILWDADGLYITPTGSVFVSKSIREGILPAMLKEILETRIKVKYAMKGFHKNKNKLSAALYRVLDARQYALKMIANVTYGFTAASFSGRMPCAELADTIVRLSRESLQKCIDTIMLKKLPRWKTFEVVYGDTDSLFVLMKYKTMSEAFLFSEDIAETLSVFFPPPMKLQFEKVYEQCFLLAKKRYIGAIFESKREWEKYKEHSIKLKLEAKGVEIIRRDNCRLVSVMMEKLCLVLFAKKDISLVQEEFQDYVRKMFHGEIPVMEFVISSKVRLLFNLRTQKVQSMYKAELPPPSAIVALKELTKDRNNYPLYKSRVPYVVISDLESTRLADKVEYPKFDSKVNFVYYMEHIILPSLARIFDIVGADVYIWWQSRRNLPQTIPMALNTVEHRTTRIFKYLLSSTCSLCRKPTNEEVCTGCLPKNSDIKRRQAVRYALQLKKSTLENEYLRFYKFCNTFCAVRYGTLCSNSDCTIYYRRKSSENQVAW
eukprot:augustus_masked-scaffold_7-processed-gene-14.47-mRNA-1 protein AED:0.32 eAED:0.33 QI:0/-1/0/1/-1/1/1/0/1152